MASGNAFNGDVVPVFPCLNQGHMRSTSYSVSYVLRKASGSPSADSKELRNRASASEDVKQGYVGFNKFSSNLSRSRSAQRSVLFRIVLLVPNVFNCSLKLLSDSATQDDKLTILAQLFWLSVSLLESDYEYEFLLALRLLARVMNRFPLDRPDARDKVEKLQAQLRWNSFPGVHSLLLKVSVK